MGGALGVLVSIALVIKLGGGAAARMAEQMIARQNVVSGTVSYEKITAGFAGDVELRNVVWKAPNGEIKMKMPMATASVNFFDALRSGGGIASVTNIVFNKPEFYGVYEEGQGLDLLNLLKLAGQDANRDVGRNAGQTVQPTRFRGLIEVKEGSLHLDSNGKKVALSTINSQMAFNQYPLLRASATASKEKCDLVLNMTYENGSAQVSGEAKNAAVADLLAMYPDLKNITVKAGVVPTMKIAASKDTDGWHIRLDGKPRNLAGEFFVVPFTNGEGSFTADRDEAVLHSIQAQVYGMPVTVQGTIKSGRGTPLPPVFAIGFSASHFKTQALSAGMYLDDADISFSGKLTGTAVEPKLEGIFKSDYIFAAPLKLTDVHGAFSWEFGKITLKNASALGAGAEITLGGQITLPSKEYQISLSGNNLNAAQLTDNRITGLIQVQAQVSGKDLADSAAGEGQFILEKGRYYFTENSPRSEEIRFLQGDIVVQNGQFATRNAEIKLGRNKYNVSVLTGERGNAELKLGQKTASSLF